MQWYRRVKNNALPTLQIAADQHWWSGHAGMHYRELAHWLRGMAAKCRAPYAQRELLDPARRYDTRADRIGRRACCLMIGAPPEWAFWVILAVLVFLSLRPMLKR
jgi:hypothetical protein